MRLACSPVPHSCMCPVPQLTELPARALWRSEACLLLALHSAASLLCCCWWQVKRLAGHQSRNGECNVCTLVGNRMCGASLGNSKEHCLCSVYLEAHQGIQLCFLTFHLLLSQAAAVFSEALLGQNCHGAHCRLPTHTQSGYATGRNRGGSTSTNTIQNAQKSLQEDKVCVIEQFSGHPPEKHLQCQVSFC